MSSAPSGGADATTVDSTTVAPAHTHTATTATAAPHPADVDQVGGGRPRRTPTPTLEELLHATDGRAGVHRGGGVPGSAVDRATAAPAVEGTAAPAVGGTAPGPVAQRTAAPAAGPAGDAALHTGPGAPGRPSAPTAAAGDSATAAAGPPPGEEAAAGSARGSGSETAAEDGGLTLLATSAVTARPPLLGGGFVESPSGPVAPSLGATAGALPSPPAAPRRGRRRLLWSVVVLVVLVVLAALTAVVVQLRRPVPAPVFHRALHLVAAAPGSAPALPWPAQGEAAVALPSLGVLVQSAPERPVPIASLAKIMTAYVILRDHPLAPDAQGPEVAMTDVDQDEGYVDNAQGATSVPVQPGEMLSERQLLDGLMVHSANNLADTLARWDAGGVPAFVAKMNATAAALGMASTHYVDANGLSAATVGTPADLLMLADKAMAIPTFAAVVAQPSVTLPLAGVLDNYVGSVGVDGVVGVKSGFTQAAMGCLVMAADRTVAGHEVLVLAAVTGQPGADPLGAADAADLRLVDATSAALVEVPVLRAGTSVGAVTAAWEHGDAVARTAAGVSLLAWPREEVRSRLSSSPLRAPMADGKTVARVTVLVGAERAVVPVRLTAPVRAPGLSWRLLHR